MEADRQWRGGLSTSIGMHAEVCRTLVQVLRYAIWRKAIEQNLHLVYALVYVQRDLSRCRYSLLVKVSIHFYFAYFTYTPHTSLLFHILFTYAQARHLDHLIWVRSIKSYIEQIPWYEKNLQKRQNAQWMYYESQLSYSSRRRRQHHHKGAQPTQCHEWVNRGGPRRFHVYLQRRGRSRNIVVPYIWEVIVCLCEKCWRGNRK